MVYYNLKNGWRINKTYMYYPEFKKAILVTKSGFLFLSFHHPNKIKS